MSAAGPLTNIALALIAALPLRILLSSLPPLLVDLLVNCCIINIFLALFNLVPVPPLDGSKLVAYFLPPSLRPKYESITPYGLLIIFGLFYVGLLDKVIFPLCDLIFSLLVKG